MARRDHPHLDMEVGSIVDLPFADDSFDGSLYWYSIIHTPTEQLTHVFAEAARVVRPADPSSWPSRSVTGPERWGRATAPSATTCGSNESIAHRTRSAA